MSWSNWDEGLRVGEVQELLVGTQGGLGRIGSFRLTKRSGFNGKSHVNGVCSVSFFWVGKILDLSQ